jgi:hypothetical protein
MAIRKESSIYAFRQLLKNILVQVSAKNNYHVVIFAKMYVTMESAGVLNHHVEDAIRKVCPVMAY